MANGLMPRQAASVLRLRLIEEKRTLQTQAGRLSQLKQQHARFADNVRDAMIEITDHIADATAKIDELVDELERMLG